MAVLSMGHLGTGDAFEYSYRDYRLSGDAMKRFRPGLVPTLVVAALLPLLVSLGFWQLSRGAEKERAAAKLRRAPGG